MFLVALCLQYSSYIMEKPQAYKGKIATTAVVLFLAASVLFRLTG